MNDDVLNGDIHYNVLEVKYTPDLTDEQRQWLGGYIIGVREDFTKKLTKIKKELDSKLVETMMEIQGEIRNKISAIFPAVKPKTSSKEMYKNSALIIQTTIDKLPRLIKCEQHEDEIGETIYLIKIATNELNKPLPIPELIYAQKLIEERKDNKIIEEIKKDINSILKKKMNYKGQIAFRQYII